MHGERLELLGSLRDYLQDLADSGVDGLPRETAAPVPPPVAERAADSPAPPSATPVRETLEEIRADLGDCRRCKLSSGRKNIVFGVGNPRARLLFVGEAPGRDEDLHGEPFVGEAGQLLTRLINRMGLTRDDVYICNVIKCRPPSNRDPEQEEIEQCHPFMLRQVKAIAPDVIVALGKFAAQTLLNTSTPISKLRGTFRDYNGIPLMPTFHPSYLLHNKDNADFFWLVWEDMVQVLQKLGMPVPDVQRKSR
jgi:DNA polymerase